MIDAATMDTKKKEKESDKKVMRPEVNVEREKKETKAEERRREKR